MSPENAGTRDELDTPIDFANPGRCNYGITADPPECDTPATICTEEGWWWCREHAASFYECSAILLDAIRTQRATPPAAAPTDSGT